MLDNDTCNKIVNFVSRDMYCQEPLLRGASQCNLLGILFTSSDFTDLISSNEVEHIVDGFKSIMPFTGSKGILIRNTPLWLKLLEWVEPTVKSTTTEKLVETIINRANYTTPQTIKYQLAYILGLVSIVCCDITEPKNQDGLINVMNNLWSQFLSVANRPYSTLGFTFYMYALASIVSIKNPPLKRRGKEKIYKFCDLEVEKQVDTYSEFVIANITEICGVIHRFFQTPEMDDILYLDDGLIVLGDTIRMVDVHDKVFSSLTSNFSAKKINVISELLVAMTKEFQHLMNMKQVLGTSHALKKLSIMKVLGHNWWQGHCSCFRFSNLQRNDSTPRFDPNENECQNCLSSGPLPFQSMQDEICCFHWLTKCEQDNFPSLPLMDPNQKEREILNRSDQKFWGTLQCQYLASQWKCIRNWLTLYCCKPNEPNIENISSWKAANGHPEESYDNGFDWKYPLNAEFIINEGLSALSVGGLEALVPVQNCIAYVTNCPQFNFLSDEIPQTSPTIFKTIVKELVPQAKSAVLDARKNEEFWPALDAFIEMSFGANLLIYEDLLEENLNLLKELFTLSDTINGVACLISKHFLKITRKNLIHFDFFKEMLAFTSLYGSLHKKDHAQYMKANQLIHSLGSSAIPANLIEGSDHSVDSSMKICTIEMLENASRIYQGRKGMVAEIISAIMQHASNLIGTRDQHYFENSFTHLILIRMHQVFLCITKLPMEEEDVIWLAEILLRRISQELGHQLSVRYLCEWTLVALSISNQNRFQTVVLQLVQESFVQASKGRINCVPSYIVILSHMALISVRGAYIDKGQSVELLENVIDLVSPWCMSQQFTTRLYSQIFFVRLYSEVEELGLKDLKEKLHVLKKCVSDSLNFGDQDKNTEKIMSDFYLTKFDPTSNFNLENMFYDFPRLLNLLPQEWVAKEMFKTRFKQGKPIKVLDSIELTRWSPSFL